jgi:hypothetical protein
MSIIAVTPLRLRQEEFSAGLYNMISVSIGGFELPQLNNFLVS